MGDQREPTIKTIGEAHSIGEAWRFARWNPKSGGGRIAQDVLSARLGITTSYLSLIENCHRPNPPSPLLKAMSKATGYTMEELFPDPHVDNPQ